MGMARAWRGLVTLFELIDPRPYKNQPPMYGRLIYTVTYKSDRLLTQEISNRHLTPPPELRSYYRDWVLQLFPLYLKWRTP